MGAEDLANRPPPPAAIRRAARSVRRVGGELLERRCTAALLTALCRARPPRGANGVGMSHGRHDECGGRAVRHAHTGRTITLGDTHARSKTPSRSARCCSNRGHGVCSDFVMSGQQSRQPGMPCASRAVLKPLRRGCSKPGSSTLRDDLAPAATLRSLTVRDDRMPTRPRPAMRRGCWSWQPPRTTVRQWRTRCDGRLSCAIPLARPSNGARRTDGTSGGTPTFPTAEQASRDLPVG